MNDHVGDDTGYTLMSTPEHVVYTLYNPHNGMPICQMSYTAEQAEDLAASLMMLAAAVRMAQADSQQDGDSGTK